MRSLIRRTLLLVGTPALLLAQKPTARQLFDAYANAVGGLAAHRALPGMTQTGTIDITFAGMTAPWENLLTEGRSLMTFDIANFGKFLRGYDGSIAWTMDPQQGAQKASGQELAAARNGASMTSGLYPEGSYTAADVLDEAQFEGVATWPVRMTMASGRVATVYYDKATSLKLGQVSATPAGEQKIIYGEYKQFGTIKVPTRITQGTPNGDIVISIANVTFAPIDAAAFTPPDAVRALP
jgi:hypothetical protein